MKETKKRARAPRVASRVTYRVLGLAARIVRTVVGGWASRMVDLVHIAALRTQKADCGISRQASHILLDLSRLSAPGLCLLLLLAPGVRGDTILGQADVWDIQCDLAVAQLVPVQANRTILVTSDFMKPQRFPFATFEFHATEANVRANWPAIIEQVRLQGVLRGCTPQQLTFVSARGSYNDLARTLDARRPAGVSSNVDFSNGVHQFPFTHADMQFAESRSQAFLIEAPDARKYDPHFGAARRVMGAVVFLLYPGHLLRSEREKPYLYVWKGTEYDFDKELPYVTRENLTTPSIQARLRGELGANLPLPSAIPSPDSTIPAATQGASPFSTLATYDRESDRAIHLLVERDRFGKAGRDCVAFKTHAEMRRCFVLGAAILLASPDAKQYDDEFAWRDMRVMGAVVYPKFDARVAFIARWDSVLEEYVDTGYGDINPDNQICRECLWSQIVQANIRRHIAANFSGLPEIDLTAYTTPEFKYHLTHDEAAAILARNPSSCAGLFTDVQPQGWFDEGFDPYLAGFICDTGDLRRIWKWIPETGASYEIKGVIWKSKTEERYAAALLRHALEFRPAARLDFRTGVVDKAAAARADAQTAAAEEAHQRARDAQIARIKRYVAVYGGGAAAVITPLVLLIFFVRASQARARRRRIAVVQDELNQAVERESESARLLRLANEELREARARSKKAHEFRDNVQKKAKQLIREVKIDE
ncbi:MAG TPA: hypothetical protein VGF28_11090 [Thermoanaerobaculia bacterium]